MATFFISENCRVSTDENGSMLFSQLNDNGEVESRYGLYGEETAALTRYLVADTLKELGLEADKRMDSMGDVEKINFTGYIAGIKFMQRLIRAKLKGGEDGAKV